MRTRNSLTDFVRQLVGRSFCWLARVEKGENALTILHLLLSMCRTLCGVGDGVDLGCTPLPTRPQWRFVLRYKINILFLFVLLAWPQGDKFRETCANFLKNQGHALDMLREKTKKDPKLGKFLQEKEEDQRCRRLQFKVWFLSWFNLGKLIPFSR